MSTATSVGAGDLAVQARQVFANMAGSLCRRPRPARQVTRITIFVVGHRREYLPVIEEPGLALFGDHKPADALIGVQTLSNPDYLIEVEAIAVIDD